MCINTSPTPEKCFLNTFQASPAPERYQISIYIERAGEVFKYTSPSPKKPGKYLKNTFPASEKYLYTLFRRRRSAYIHLSGAGKAEEVFIYTQVED